MSSQNVSDAGGTDRSRQLRARATSFAGKYATLIAFAAMVVLFCVEFPDTFATWVNLKAILKSAAPLLVLAVGLTVVVIVGEFDLSFPGVTNLAALGAVTAMANHGSGAVVAIGIGLAVGIAAGAIAGMLVITDRASSFIITLALNTIWAAVALAVSGGKFINEVTSGYTDVSRSTLILPVPVIVGIAAILLAFVLMKWTVFGRDVRAVGSNREAARLAGLRVGLTRAGTFVFLGLCAGVAGVLLSTSTGGYTPDMGTGLFIPPFVATFFGISVLAAGRFNIFGTVVGALFIQTLQTGLTFYGVSAWVSGVVIGTTLLVILMIAGQLRGSAWR